MVVHLYDEYPYPSGIAGGLVTMGQPQFQATELLQQTFDLEGSFGVSLNPLHLVNHHRLTHNLTKWGICHPGLIQ